MRVGGQRYAPFILYEWYFTRTKAHVLFAETSCLSHGFLGASKKTSRLIRSRLHAVVVGLRVIYLPEHSACIEQMLKQLPSCFNASRLASGDKRDETSVVCANRILHAGTHCALSCGDAMTQAFTHMALLMLSGGAMERQQRH
jgi:hypothetical protein